MLEALMKACIERRPELWFDTGRRHKWRRERDHRRNELHLTSAEAKDGCFLDALSAAEAANAASKLPFRSLSASRESPRGLQRGEDER
jgi:hypothetical protein